MPKLPDATDLNRVGYDAARKFVPIPDVNIEGAYNRLAAGISNLGAGIGQFAQSQEENYRKTERFNANIQLLDAEARYNEEASKLDPLSPDYKDKVVAAWDNAVRPIMTGIKDPENKRTYGEKLLENRFTLSSGAQKNQEAAISDKASQDIQNFIDVSRKRLRSDLNENPETVYQSINQMIDDAPLNPEQKAKLKKDVLPKIDRDAVENTALRVRSGALSGGGYYARLRQIESNNNPAAYNKNSGASGLYQIIPSTAKAYGVTNPFDVEQSEIFVRRFTAENASVLRKALGREPSAGELYLAHQQGAGGALKLLKNPNARAIDVVGGDEIRLNGGRSDMSAGEFANMWISRFEGVEQPDGSPYVPVTNDYVISQVMQSPQYKRLPIDEQDSVISSIKSQLKKMDDEQQIEMSRRAVDFATTNFADRKEATDFVKNAITDPRSRESALTMLTAEYNRIEEAQKIANNEQIRKVWDQVIEATESGNYSSAIGAIPDDIDPEEKIKLKKYIEDGRAAKDDVDLYRSILSMKLGSDDDRQRFMNLDLVPYIGLLKPSTIEALVKDQDEMKRKLEAGGKLPTLETTSAVLDQRLREIGIDTGTKASPADLKATRNIRSIVQGNLEAAQRLSGNELSQSDIDKVIDQSFMQFRGKSPGWLWSSDATFDLEDVVTKYASEEQRLGVPDGSLLSEALDDFRSADPNFVVNGAALDQWLKMKTSRGAQ